MIIPKSILKEIKYFCELNEIEDIDKFVIDILKIGFNVEKYGNDGSLPRLYVGTVCCKVWANVIILLFCPGIQRARQVYLEATAIFARSKPACTKLKICCRKLPMNLLHSMKIL